MRARRLAVLLALLPVVGTCVTASLVTAEEEPGLKVIGDMAAAVTINEKPPPLLVDEQRSLGFAAGEGVFAQPPEVVMYDLATLKVVDRVTEEGAQNDFPTRFAVDEDGERLLRVLPGGIAGCVTGSGGLLRTWSYAADANGKRALRVKDVRLPCAGRDGFSPTHVRYHAPSKKLYMIGYYASENWRESTNSLAGTKENDGSSLLVQQVDLSGLDHNPPTPPTIEWQIDLRYAGCGRRHYLTGESGGIYFVDRVGNDVISHCADNRVGAYNTQVGRQRYLVRIPLDGSGRPKLDGEQPEADPQGSLRNTAVRRMPSFGDAPVLDHRTGMVLLTTSDKVNGNGVWVQDPFAERFVGAVTGGFADQPPGNTAVGFDRERGRVYLLTAGGLLMAPVRHRPLPAGTLAPDVLPNPQFKPDFAVPEIAVAPRLERLFVPLRRNASNGECPADPGKICGSYAVVQDDTAEPADPEPADPDSLTTQVDEAPGRTEADVSGQALASGAHVVITGGVVKTVNQADPFCNDPSPAGDAPYEIEPRLLGGGCLAGEVVAPGHREFSLATTGIESSTSGGAVGYGSGLGFGQGDTTGSDISRPSDCGQSAPDAADGWGRASPVPGSGEFRPQEQWDAFMPARDAVVQGLQPPRQEFNESYGPQCASAQDQVAEDGGPDLRGGTVGRDGEGFPVTSATCSDFGAGAEGAREGDPTLGFSSSTDCDAERHRASATAGAGALAVGAPGAPAVTVARTASSVETFATKAGRRTVATAIATGVTLGPVTIGEVRATAVTLARGRTGTAHTTFRREWCQVVVPGGPSTSGCFDPADDANRKAIDDLNQALGTIRVNVPTAESTATPGGYQAVVTKDPDVRAADQAVNDDDSHTVAGMEVVVYNDGLEGRNRYIVHLAGVHAESRYGIVLLPRMSDGWTPPSFGPGDDPSAVGNQLRKAGTAQLDGQGVATVEGRLAAQAEPVGDDGDSGPNNVIEFIERLVRPAVDVVRDGFRLLVNHPGEFFLLFCLWSLLATPVYLGQRRRAFARAVVS